MKTFTPESILPDGVDSTTSTNPYTQESGDVRKGTVAAILNNIAALNQLFQSGQIGHILEIEKVIKSLIPSLRVIGLFDMFEPYEWIGNAKQPGRLLVVLLYLEEYPQELSSTVKQQLRDLKDLPPYLQQKLDLCSS